MGVAAIQFPPIFQANCVTCFVQPLYPKGKYLHTVGGTKIVRILKSLFKTITPVAFMTRSPDLI